MSLTTFTINSVNYQSYATVAEADGYLAVDISRAAAWAALDVPTKESRLVESTRRLDRFTWIGEKTDPIPTQTTEFPRTGLTDKNGLAVPEATVPQEVEDATIIQAGDIVLSGDSPDEGSTADNNKRLKAGSVEIERFRPVDGKKLADNLIELVGIFLSGATSGIAVGALASGTDAVSSFCDPKPFGRIDGLS